MFSYIIFNTLIYGTLAWAMASWYSYAKFLHAGLGGIMILGTYSIAGLISSPLGQIKPILTLLALICIYFLINKIIIRSFPNEQQRDLFGLIFTLGASLLIENSISLLYGPNAVHISGGAISPRIYAGGIAALIIITTYFFHVSYIGKIRQAIATQTRVVRSLGIRVERLLHILATFLMPVFIGIGILIANESALKPSDNLFYLIKAIGIMILVGVEQKQYMYMGAVVYVTLEYLFFITIGLPISYKETLILICILLILLIKPQGLFSFRSRNI